MSTRRAARPSAGRAGRDLRLLLPDLRPLRSSREYRLVWTGSIVSEAGSQITLVALYVQVFALTGSTTAVGLIGLVQLVPLAVAALLGGPVIDALDRRKLLLVSQVGQAFGSAMLLVGTLSGRPPVVLVYGAAALVAGLSGFALSIRSALIPNLVEPGELPAALALNQVMWNTALIVGPAVGGVVIAQLGLSWAYGIDLVSFSATIVAAAMMRPAPPRISSAPSDQPGGRGAMATAGRRVAEGFRYLRGRRVLWSTFAIDLVAMIFGMPRALFPILAVRQFHGGAEIVGVLFSAVSAGALAGALTTGWVGGVRRQGLAVLVAVAVWGAGITAFGLSGSALWLAILCLAVAGAADVISAVFRGTILQLGVPDDLRGRISGVHILVVTGGPRIGDFEAGVVASLFSPTVSVVSGGLLCMGGAVVLAALVPELGRYRPSVEAATG